MGINKRLLENRRRNRGGYYGGSVPTDMPSTNIPLTDDFTLIRKYNTDVRRWAIEVEKMLESSVRRLTHRQRIFFFKKLRKYKAEHKAVKAKTSDKLEENIKKRIRKNGYGGQISSVGFRFPIHGIYLHHGVSRGHPADRKRKQVDWFNPVIESKLPDLVDIAARYYADAIVNYDKIFIR